MNTMTLGRHTLLNSQTTNNNITNIQTCEMRRTLSLLFLGPEMMYYVGLGKKCYSFVTGILLWKIK